MAMMMMTLNHETGRMLAVAVSMGWLFLIFATGAFAQELFFQGKTITVIQGREPGGTGDLRARAIPQKC